MTRLLTPAEVADLTRLAPQTLAHWRSAGKGPPYIKVSTYRVMYPADRLEKWLDSRLVVPNGRARV